MSICNKECQLTIGMLEEKHNVASYFAICRDYFGNPISIGDYVVGCVASNQSYHLEGYVVDIIEHDYGFYIKLATLGGRIVTNSDSPYNYIVAKK